MKRILSVILLLTTTNLLHSSLFVSAQPENLDNLMEQNRKRIENKINSINSQSKEQYHFEPDMHVAHITLVYFTDADPTITAANASQKYPGLHEKLSAIAKKTVPIDLTKSIQQSKITYFKSGRRDIMLGGSSKTNYLTAVLELGENVQLTALAYELRKEIENSYGIKPTFPIFKAHLTLGRIYEINDSPLVNTLENILKIPVVAELTKIYIDKVVLVGSGDTLSFPLSKETFQVHTKDDYTVFIPIDLVKDSKYLTELSQAGRAFKVDLTQQELDLLVSILQNPSIISAVSQNRINLKPFQHLTRKDFFDLITKFGLSRDLFTNVWTLVRDYTVLIGSNGFVYPMLNSDVDKIAFFKELKADMPIKERWFLELAVPINAKIMQMILDLFNVSSFDIIKKKLESWSAQEMIMLIEIFDYFGFDFQTKTCFVILSLKEKQDKTRIDFSIKDKIAITLKDLKDFGVIPSITGAKIRAAGKEATVPALDLSGYGLSEITTITDYFPPESLDNLLGLDLSFNRLKDISSLPVMRNLWFLDLSFNNLQASSLENWFKGNAPRLFILGLNNNNINFAEIEAGWAKDLKFLNELNLSNNRRATNRAMTDIFMPGWSLGLSGTIVRDQDNVEQVSGGLKKLDLSYNNIKKLWSGWAKGLAQLQKLDLRGNPIKELEKGWAQGLKNLQEIIIDKNSSVKTSINWELNGVLAYFGIRKSKVKIIERETEKELA